MKQMETIAVFPRDERLASPLSLKIINYPLMTTERGIPSYNKAIHLSSFSHRITSSGLTTQGNVSVPHSNIFSVLAVTDYISIAQHDNLQSSYCHFHELSKTILYYILLYLFLRILFTQISF